MAGNVREENSGVRGLEGTVTDALSNEEKEVSLAGSRTPLSRVTGGCTSRYTTRDRVNEIYFPDYSPQ